VVGGELFWEDLNSSSLGDQSERRGAAFVEALVRPLNSTVLSMGVRADWHQGFGAFVSPSVSASLIPNSLLKIRTALGRSFRAPTWTERYYQDPVNIGRPDLEPEQAWSSEMGFDLYPSPVVSLSTTLFLRRATSLIDWARAETALETDPWETRNVKSATFRGIEAELNVMGPFGLEWTLGGTLLSLQSDEESGYRSKYALRPLEEQVTLGIGRTLGSNISTRVRMHHGRRRGEESYRRLDVRVSTWVGVGWLHFDVNNVTDFNYPDVTGVRAPGRAVFVGLAVARR
jgi:iron complex outermembrane receptor protein